jgi:AcrR family transcriptional regulator
VPSRNTADAATPAVPARVRRPRGEPRRLLIAAACDLFNRKGYSSTSTREISELAGVSEPLIFRNFRSKAGLFREAMVQPFVDAIDREIEHRRARPPSTELNEADTRAFVAAMYDVFHEHRALASMVFAADALIESEVAEAGVIDDVRAAIDRFVTYASDEARAHGKDIGPAAHDLAIRGHMAMVAGVATFGSWYFGKRRPSRRAVIDEMSRWVWLRYNATLP